MYKIIALLTKKSGMSMADFIDYYETRHAVLAREVFPEIREYRRNYVKQTGPGASAEHPGFDCLTELYFESEADANAMLSRLANDPNTLSRVQEDEAKLFDRSKIKSMAMDEHSS